METSFGMQVLNNVMATGASLDFWVGVGVGGLVGRPAFTYSVRFLSWGFGQLKSLTSK